MDRGACPPGPAYRGPWATSPSWPGLLRLAPARHTGNVASITTQRTELARRSGLHGTDYARVDWQFH